MSATVSVIREDGTYTAVKRNGKVVVLREDGTVAQEFGGNRATRATAVLLAGWADEDFTRFLGCRADFEAAEKEAARLVRGTKRITNPAAWAIALPVTEEEGVVVSASAKSSSNLFKCSHPRCGLRIAVEYSTSGSDLGRWAHLNTVAGIAADKDHAAVPPTSRPSNKYNGQVRCACGCKYWGEDDLCVDCGRDILTFSPQINAITDKTEAPDLRVALIEVRGGPGFATEELRRVEAYLPRNFVAYLTASDGQHSQTIRISGYDNAGWTLQDYVIPRLASGLIFATEVTSANSTEGR